MSQAQRAAASTSQYSQEEWAEVRGADAAQVEPQADRRASAEGPRPISAETIYRQIQARPRARG